MQMVTLLIVVSALVGTAAPRVDPQPSGSVVPQKAALYHVMLMRAAPGRLLELMDHLQRQAEEGRAAGSGAPFIMRHSQGDQWDLMLLSLADEGSVSLPERRMMESRVDSLIAWREDLWVRGPTPEVVDATLADAGYFHVEMFVALPGKRAELLAQREMENAYLSGIERPLNLIFVRAGGAAWDMFTLGAYRDLKHFAESADVPDELQQRAAVAAGFEGADRIGTYLRSLIAYHHDTLATAVR
jgi:hypothetical protein